MSACTTVEPQFESKDSQQQAQTRVSLGMSYLRIKQLDFAEQEFNKALSLSKQADGAYHGLGLIAIQRENVPLALSLLGKAVSLNSHNLNAISDYAVVLCRNQQASAGLAQLQKINGQQVAASSLNTALALGVCHLALKHYAQAGQAYRQALQVNPRLESALLPMVEISQQLGNALAARAYIERYFGAGYSSPKALLLGAEVERLLDNRQQQQRYLQQLWARYPASPQARAARK